MADRLLIMAKAPEPGRVKTRLTSLLDPVAAASVYEACLADVVDRARQADVPLVLNYDPAPGADRYFETRYPDLPRLPQVAGDLGARLHHALDRAFADGATRVAVIGADSPTLPPATLREALRRLHRHEIVLGPTTDGGYYLLGARRAAWPRAGTLLESVPWSTEQVLPVTLHRARTEGLDVHLLHEWYDVDLPPDLLRARADAQPGSHLARALDALTRPGGALDGSHPRVPPPGRGIRSP
jgi:uncharacterized protein